MDRSHAPHESAPGPTPGHRSAMAAFGLALLALALLTGFWQLCRWQVEQAQARHATFRAERIAASDCSAAVIVDADGRRVRPAPGTRCADVRQLQSRSAD